MNKQKTLFQYVMMAAFGVMFLIGFVIFSINPTPDSEKKVHVGEVVIWGTLDRNVFDKLISQLKEMDSEYSRVSYVEKSKSNFNQELLEGLATGNIPDLILMSNYDLMQNMNKLYKIDHNVISDRQYKTTFLDAFSIFTAKDGVWGIPFIIDPMVLFYNKTLFKTNALLKTPTFWSELIMPGNQFQRLRVYDNTGENILSSAIALGEANNIRNYKEILYTLFLQKNNPIIENTKEGYEIDGVNFPKASESISFYTKFSDSSNKTTYYWNKSKDRNDDEFLAGNLGMYLGFVSEIRMLRMKNPNLNFGIAEIPRYQNGERTTYAKTWAFVLPKQCPKIQTGGGEVCKNRSGAITVAKALSSEKIQKTLIDILYLPPVRKDMILEKMNNQVAIDENGDPITSGKNFELVINKSVVNDINKDIFYREAVYANSILDLGSDKTGKIFSQYIEAVATRLKSASSATDTLKKELEYLLKKYGF